MAETHLKEEEEYLVEEGQAPLLPPPYPTPPESSAPPVYSSALHSAPSRQRYSLIEAYILGIPLGFLGLHHYYLGRIGFGLFYTFTVGGFGLGWILDWFRMPFLVREANKKACNPGICMDKSVLDAYILWLPFGVLGFHHFYLNRIGWGMFYLFTLGGVGVGWLYDGFRMVSMVKKINNKHLQTQINGQLLKDQGDAYGLALIPITGIFGVHHAYLGRPTFVVLYTMTLGLLGVGWLIDLFRTPFLTRSINRQILSGSNWRLKRLDDAYLLLFPFGFLGLHHFYLRRPVWGCLYLFTLGCFLIGWLIDFCRLPSLVRNCNAKIMSQQLSHIPHHPRPQQPSAPNEPYPSADPLRTTPTGYGSLRSWTTVGPDSDILAATTLRDQPPSYHEVVRSNASNSDA